MKKKLCLGLLLTLLLSAAHVRAGDVPDFPWMKNVGAKSFPAGTAVYDVADYGAKGDALELCTRQIQKAIDDCAAKGGGIVTFQPGIYLTGSIFIKENVNFNVPKGTMLIGSQNIEDYTRIPSRIAGVEMEWPAALVNVVDQKNLAITGEGVIHGKGKVFWDKYWAMRKEYEPKKLRWIVDYDCERPRGILIENCENVTVKDIVIYQPGFWSLHILYSNQVTVDNIIISNNIEGRGPSTDGVDIDSSTNILVENSNINCNDDNFCLKAGRDWDGLRVNRPCEYVVIRNCIAGHGAGLFTCGSETSGGIRNVVVYNMKAYGTDYGLRFKSTTQRGGVIENIYLSNIEMIGVRNPFIVDLNWNPAYSSSKLPKGYDVNTIPEHWKKMIAEVDPVRGTPKFRNIYFENVTATDAENCIVVAGLEGAGTIDNFSLKNVSLEGRKAGSVRWANDWTIDGLKVKAHEGGNKVKVVNCKGVNLTNK